MADESKYDTLSKALESDQKVISEVHLGKRIGFYKIYQLLGRGAFAKVKLGNHCLIGAKVAIKIVHKEHLDEKILALLSQEIKCMTEIAHPHILRLFELIDTSTHMYIVTEFAPSGCLTETIEKYTKMPEKMAKTYFAQILSAVQYIHEKDIIHRDIKTDNILIHGESCKLADFGFCTISSKESHLDTFCGSPSYAAPEIFKDDPYVGRYSDIWALGVVLYYMTVGDLPFQGGTIGKMKQQVLSGIYTEFPHFLSPSLKFLISKILKVYPQDRLTVEEMMRSTWMEGVMFANPLPSNRIKPPFPEEEMDKVEKDAMLELNNLGIKGSKIKERPNAIRDRINGTYRLAYYQAERVEQRKKNKLAEAKLEKRAAHLALAEKKSNPISKLCILM